jgi:hypothetical protein
VFRISSQYLLVGVAAVAAAFMGILGNWQKVADTWWLFGPVALFVAVLYLILFFVKLNRNWDRIRVEDPAPTVMETKPLAIHAAIQVVIVLAVGLILLAVPSASLGTSMVVLGTGIAAILTALWIRHREGREGIDLVTGSMWRGSPSKRVRRIAKPRSPAG